MIRGIHALCFTPKADELREFFRDKLGIPFTDTGDGWLIFDFAEGDLGCHPSRKSFHTISFSCDDIEKTVRTLKRRGVRFTSGISEQSWGYLARFVMPGRFEAELYQPKYKKSTHRRQSTKQTRS